MCSRTWKADDFLESIAQTIVIKKRSIMNVIRYSDIYKHRFEKHVRNMETNPTTANAIRDISSAKHRFESLSKPFGRGCIYWHSLVVTAQQVLDERGAAHAAGAAALEFLEFVNEAPKVDSRYGSQVGVCVCVRPPPKLQEATQLISSGNHKPKPKSTTLHL